MVENKQLVFKEVEDFLKEVFRSMRDFVGGKQEATGVSAYC